VITHLSWGQRILQLERRELRAIINGTPRSAYAKRRVARFIGHRCTPTGVAAGHRYGAPAAIFVRPGGEIAEVWVGALNADGLRELVAEHFGVLA